MGMHTLPLAPFPTGDLRSKISKTDWDAGGKAWIETLKIYLMIPSPQFAASQERRNIASTFLSSYMQQNALSGTSPGLQPLSKVDAEMRVLSFRLAHRLLLEKPTQLREPKAAALSLLTTFSFLGDFCSVYRSSPTMPVLVQNVWERNKLDESVDMMEHKKSLLYLVTSKTPLVSRQVLLQRMISLSRACSSYGRFLLADFDIVEALIEIWSAGSTDARRDVNRIVFLVIKSALAAPQPNVSVLLDLLYDLKTSIERCPTGKHQTFVGELVLYTPLLQLLRKRIPSTASNRIQPILLYLASFKDTKTIPRRHRRKVEQAERANLEMSTVNDTHSQRRNEIVRVQELFPEFDSGFVIKLLNQYGGNVEQVTAHVLENTLPPHLMNADQSESLALSDLNMVSDDDDRQLSSQSNQFPERKNTYDDDELDNLALPTTQLHIGKQEESNAGKSKLNKARIYDALYAFDSDDDERDDTYDAEDVGATVDVQGYEQDRDDIKREQDEELLFRTWRVEPSAFARQASARSSSVRLALKEKTGMTDEAIEGWAVMLQRNPKRTRILESRYPDFTGQQDELASTRWTPNTGDADGEVPRGTHRNTRRRGGARGRGQGLRQGGGEDRKTDQQFDNQDSQIARRRKDENKASQANHNRRAQRAKKMVKVGLPG